MPGNPRRRRPLPFFPFFPACCSTLAVIFFIIFFVSLNFLMSWLTSVTVTPAPAAMRARRLPLSTSGRARSSLVMELMMTSMASSAPSSTWPDPSALSPPGSALTSLEMPPILRIWRFMVTKSSNVRLPLARRSASTASASSCWTRTALSMSDTTSPMPRMRLAMRSGWNSSSESGFSPDETNLMGLPVTSRMDSAPPPRASPSIFDMMTPSKSTCSAKASTTFTTSWPVMASTTMRIWSGLTASLMAWASAIMSSSTCKRPAVSMMTTSRKLSMASWMPSLAMRTGSVPSPRYTRTPISSPKVCSWSAAAGRYTSPAMSSGE